MSEDTQPTTTDNGLTKTEDLFARPAKRRFRTLDPTPVGGMRLRIRSLTAGEMAKYQRSPINSRGKLIPARFEDAEARFLVLCVVDADGNPILTAADVPKIMSHWDAADTQYLYEECAKHCGVGAEELENLRKNLRETLTDS